MVDWNGHFRVYCKKMTGQRRERHGTAADRMRGDGGGNARRFGENKLAVQVQGKALFHRALEAVPAERFIRTVVVSQYPEVLELAHRMGFVPVPNRHPDWGISHTISLGLESCRRWMRRCFRWRISPCCAGRAWGCWWTFTGSIRSTSLRWVTAASGESLSVPGTAVPGAAGSAGRSRRQSGDPPP